jgi:acetylornithine/LysW-gamma-L-lysine aminotransferase
MITCHGSFYNDARAEFIEKLAGIMPSGLDQFFLCNSGAEAVECALKLARKYTGRKEVLAMMRAYHGKTMGALSATWKPKYKEGFEPLVPGFKHVPYGSLEKVEEEMNENVAAVIVEAIQGEGGVHVAPNGYLPGLRELCNDGGSLLILDEVQTGLGRTGKMFAFEHWNIVPDIVCLAKGIAGGLPMGVVAARREVMSSFKVGDHTTTFGGSPLVCAAASATLDVILHERLVDKARRLGGSFKNKLEELGRKLNVVREVRGLGLMLGMELRVKCRDAILEALEKGVILMDAGVNVLRFLPPLVVEEGQLNQVVEVLEEVLEE